MLEDYAAQFYQKPIIFLAESFHCQEGYVRKRSKSIFTDNKVQLVFNLAINHRALVCISIHFC